MEAKILMEEVIEEGKWTQNDIGMWKLQCSKLVKDKEKLFLIIVSQKLDYPIISKVETALVANGELIIFYDNEYKEKIDKGNYESYRNKINEKEWSIIFSNNPVERLLKTDLVSDRLGYYAEAHETMEQYLQNGYDIKETNEVREKFNVQ